jgi:hypothetical protein
MICLLQVFEQIGIKNIPTTGTSQRVALGGVKKAQDRGLGGNPWLRLSDSSV